MSKVLVEESNLSSIAGAIRSKVGGSTLYKPSEMAAAIGNIPTGITPTGTVNISQNGTVDVTQYASAAVAVPNSYSAGDEGKVVSNGALVAQESQTITQNGTYDTTLKNEVIVNVSGSGGDVPLLTKATWDALTIAQKRTYGLIAVQNSDTGFSRGRLLYGADYAPPKHGDFVPSYSWNASNNALNTYNFESTTPTNNSTEYCLAAMSQNGNNPSYDSDLNNIAIGADGNGNYAIVYGAYDEGKFASTFSSGNNWNNSEIICFCLSGDASPIVLKELFYEQGKNGTYTYTYQATSDENLLLIVMKGGSASSNYTINGLTLKSHVTSSGGRFNDVYYGTVDNGDVVSVSIPYAKGDVNNGSLFVALLSVEAES